MPSRLPSKLLVDLKAVVGEKNILTEPADLYVHSFDSALDRSIPIAVVIPQTSNQVGPVIRALVRHKQAYVARGAGTSLCGGPIPLNEAVVVSLARLKTIGRVDLKTREIRVEPGVVNLKLQDAIAKDDLFYPPDPGSQKACTIGGNVATNAGGPHCLKYGVTSQSVTGLEWILPDGQVINIRTSDPGFDLVGFFVGSEGTLGIASHITLQLQPKPPFVRTMVVSFNSIEEAIQSVTDIIASGILPATLEAMDRTIVEAVEAFIHAGYPTEAEAVLLIEVDGDEKMKLDDQVKKIEDACKKNNSFDFKYAKDENERKKLWEGRRGSYAAMARLAPNVLVEDGAVPRTKLPEALKKIKDIAERSALDVALLFHAGDGNLHPQILFDERDPEQTKIVKKAGYDMLKACVDLGGTISGEHGVGVDKREAMKWLFSRETLSLFRRLKNIFDPNNLCNPDKLIPLVSKSTIHHQKGSDEGGVPEVNRMEGMAPASETELVEVVRDYARSSRRFGIQGSKSRYRVHENEIVQLKNLNQVLDFDKANFTLRVQGGALLKDIRETVEKEGAYLWVGGEGTVGGTIATRASMLPPLRDQILAMRVLIPTGEIVSFGANTVKNVAGYDVPKLLIGSWGTLGIILDVTFKLWATPPANFRIEKKSRPFVFRDIHVRIKKAFDPKEILGQRTALMTPSEIEKAEKQQEQQKTSSPDPKVDRYGDGFWR